MTLNISSPTRLKRFPYWLRQSVRINRNAADTSGLLADRAINTVCRSARCPNIHDCFSRKKCTFLILGNYCARDCKFCAIETKAGLPPPDKKELFDIKEAVMLLGISKVIITSVTRDDLGDGGAGHFADCIGILRGYKQDLSIETLVPDFLGKFSSVARVVSAGPDVFSHNVETVPRLYNKVRPQAGYERSLDVIRYAKEINPALLTKSGLMTGLGERRDEVYSTMKDLKDAGCDMITIGQYLKPASGCLDVAEFLRPGEFGIFSEWAKGLGFKKFSCSPFTRSSLLE